MKNKTIRTAIILASFFSTKTLALCDMPLFDGSWFSDNGESFLTINAKCVSSERGSDTMVYDIESHLGQASSYRVYGNEMNIIYSKGAQSVKLISDSLVEVQTQEILVRSDLR